MALKAHLLLIWGALSTLEGSKLWEVPSAPRSSLNVTGKLYWESQCNFQLRHLQDGAQVTALIPPRLEGSWVSTGCEVRPGPEFLTRFYIFYPNRLFKALQFYYRDGRCHEPSYSLVIKGKLRLRQASWITRGATETDHHLHKVGIVFHSQNTIHEFLLQINQTCPQLLSGWGSWVLGSMYELYSAKTGRDCRAALGFSMMELSILRVEKHHHPQGKLVEELLLGDVHTDWSQRTMYRPTGYQRPLQSAVNHVHPCPICGIIFRSSEHHPPILPLHPQIPVSLHGKWVSWECEVRPAVLFLTRYFIFHEHNSSWEGFYYHYSDPACRQPTFIVHAAGHYISDGHSTFCDGGTKFTFKVTQARVTPVDKASVQLLNSSKEGTCGDSGQWTIGVEQDITGTKGCTVLGIKLPHKEYELFKMQLDHKGRLLLFTGERPTDGSSPDRPQKRPTSYQAPLVQCTASAEQVDRHDQLLLASRSEKSILGLAAWTPTLVLGSCLIAAF
ncbi:protein APCDD1-like [Polypterus senegalus]|uniref:protein APCDD1-like n=1 Tax=Polypterus senegalus TaxID=55291 RepID=UPI0019625A70|nr:protein APCDD1-like [Polypterus senegalus]